MPFGGSCLAAELGLPDLWVRRCSAATDEAGSTATTAITRRAFRIRPCIARGPPALADYLTPTVLPRRQTTSQFRPVRASRANASRSFAGNTLGSSTVILEPVPDKSCTTHRRAAKPPSKVPPGLTHGFARFPLLHRGHFRLLPSVQTPTPRGLYEPL